MALNRLDLNLLHVFDTIYREGSLTRAGPPPHPAGGQPFPVTSAGAF